MRDDRSKPARHDRRAASVPYKTLRDRIHCEDSDRPPLVFPGRLASSSKTSGSPEESGPRYRNSKNPLYSYLDGKNRPTTTNKKDHRETKKRTQAESQPSKSNHSRVANDLMTTKGLAIHGNGSTANSISIRGASSTAVSIRNLAPGTTEADVCLILNEKIGEVESCTTFPVKGGLSTTAEVKFGSRVAADKAIQLLHGVLADSNKTLYLGENKLTSLQTSV